MSVFVAEDAKEKQKQRQRQKQRGSVCAAASAAVLVLPKLEQDGQENEGVRAPVCRVSPLCLSALSVPVVLCPSPSAPCSLSLQAGCRVSLWTVFVEKEGQESVFACVSVLVFVRQKVVVQAQRERQRQRQGEQRQRQKVETVCVVCVSRHSSVRMCVIEEREKIERR